MLPNGNGDPTSFFFAHRDVLYEQNDVVMFQGCSVKGQSLCEPIIAACMSLIKELLLWKDECVH